MNLVAPTRPRRTALILLGLSLSLPWAGAAEPASQVRLLAARTILATATLETIESRGLDTNEDGGAARRAQCVALAKEALESIAVVTGEPASRDDVLQLSRAVKGLLTWIEEKLTTAEDGTPLLDERAAAVATCVKVAKHFSEGANEAYIASLQSWSVDALSLSIEKSETGEARDWRILAEEWKARLGEVDFEPGSDDELARSVRTASGRILAFSSWRQPVETDPARLAADSALRTSLLKAALRAEPNLDDFRARLADAASAAAAPEASACLLWDLLKLAEVVRTEKPELWKSSEAQLWELLLDGHFHRVTVEARAVDQSNTRPLLSDWDKSDPTGGDGTWFEFEPGKVARFRVSVLARGDELLTLPDGDALGWTGSAWAVPGHPHWITVTDANGAELDVVARWEGTAKPVALPLPVKLPDSMALLYGFGDDPSGTRLLACSAMNWKRSRLAEVLLEARPDAYQALAEILATDEDAVRDNAADEIKATAAYEKKDERPFKRSEVTVFHDDLLAAEAVFRLPPSVRMDDETLGWTRFRLGWSDPEVRFVTDKAPTVDAGNYVVRNVIEIVVEESPR